jgi:hypothetical protein
MGGVAAGIRPNATGITRYGKPGKAVRKGASQETGPVVREQKQNDPPLRRRIGFIFRKVHPRLCSLGAFLPIRLYYLLLVPRGTEDINVFAEWVFA